MIFFTVIYHAIYLSQFCVTYSCGRKSRI